WRWTLCTLCCALPRQHTLCATLFPYATLFRSNHARPEPCHSGVLDRREGRAYRREVPGAGVGVSAAEREQPQEVRLARPVRAQQDRKSTRLNSSHVKISYAVFCLKKKKHQSNY